MTDQVTQAIRTNSTALHQHCCSSGTSTITGALQFEGAGTVSSLHFSADNSLHDLFVPLDHVNLMPHVDDNGLVSRVLVVHPPRRRNRQTPSMHPRASLPMLLESPSEFLHFALTWPGFDSCTKRRSYDIANQSPQSYTCARSLLWRST